MSLFEDLPDVSPLQFFSVAAPVYWCKGDLKPEKSFLLPSTHEFLGEERFANIYACWSFERLAFHFEVKHPFTHADETDLQKSDAIEIFIDTRDSKTKSVPTKFCHHFCIFPTQVKNFHAREITRFRNEDTHEICHPEDLNVKAVIKKDGYIISLEIPAFALHGFDPVTFSRLGFTYRINRYLNSPQHFSASSETHNIEAHPALWGTLHLKKEDF